MSTKIFVYTQDVEVTKAAFAAAQKDKQYDVEIIIRNISSFANKEHSDIDLVYTTDRDIQKKIRSSNTFLIELNKSMNKEKKFNAIDKIKGILNQVQPKEESDVSFLNIDMNSLPELMDSENIKTFVKKFKATYKKPIVIKTKDNKTMEIYDSEEDFGNKKDENIILMTQDEYVTIMLTALAFDARIVNIKRLTDDDDTNNRESSS